MAGGGRATTTDAAGRFTLPAQGCEELVAAAAGLGSQRHRARTAWPDPIELWLPPEPRELAGRVVDPAGVGLPGLLVWIADPTVLDRGRASGPEGLRLEHLSAHPDEFRGGRPPLLLEGLLAGEPERVWRAVETDREGRFRLGGLGARATPWWPAIPTPWCGPS